jgi:glycosyltransferase involved in cell wall biosynthesis
LIGSAGGGHASSNTSDIAVRIAYLINQYPKVSHSFIRREILALEAKGFEVMRISLRGWDLDLADEADFIERERTRYVLRTPASTLLFGLVRMLVQRPVRFARALAMAWHMSRDSLRPLHVHFAYVAEACRIEPWLRAARVKHVHAHFGTNSTEVALLVKILGGPSYSFTVHGPEEFEHAGALKLKEKILRAAFVVTISSYGRAQLWRWLAPEFWENIHVVHCGLDDNFLIPPPVVEIPSGRIVCVARLSEEKGHLLLIEAARRLTALGFDFKLIFAGDGDLRSVLEAKISHYNLTNRIQITGWLSGRQVRDEILAARALVLPSFAEGLPVVLMEAMALRRPVIATYIGGIPELVRSGQDGWLIPASDVEALVDALRACLEAPPDQISHMGGAARERVVVRHSADTEAAKLQNLFDLIASEQQSSYSEFAKPL